MAGIGFRRVYGGIGPLMNLAMASCLEICLEWRWWYEIATLMVGCLHNPTLKCGRHWNLKLLHENENMSYKDF